jgi:hypothetical protein
MAHKLNHHEANVADILLTLRDSMDNKVVALLEQKRRLRRVLLIRGVTHDALLLVALRG